MAGSVGLESGTRGEVRLGLRANWPQFSLLVLVNAFVGAMVGMERTILPPSRWRSFTSQHGRLWRDSGYAIGALLSGLIADALGVNIAISVAAAMTFASGLIVAFRMHETRQAIRGADPSVEREALLVESRGVEVRR